MQTIRLNAPDGAEPHVCQSYRNGDWIVFYCEQCADYERRLNWRTGEMKVKNHKAEVRHSGFYAPEEYKDAFESTN